MSAGSSNNTLETRRLWLQPLAIADADAIQKLFPVWEVVRFSPGQVPWPYQDDGALFHYHALPAMERNEVWHWTLGLAARRLTSSGLMTESVNAATDFSFDVLRFPVLRAPKAIANEASLCISERSGMRVVETEERQFVSNKLLLEINAGTVTGCPDEGIHLGGILIWFVDRILV